MVELLPYFEAYGI